MFTKSSPGCSTNSSYFSTLCTHQMPESWLVWDEIWRSIVDNLTDDTTPKNEMWDSSLFFVVYFYIVCIVHCTLYNIQCTIPILWRCILWYGYVYCLPSNIVQWVLEVSGLGVCSPMACYFSPKQILSHQFTHWFIGYCRSELFLGKLTHRGSSMMHGVEFISFHELNVIIYHNLEQHWFWYLKIPVHLKI